MYKTLYLWRSTFKTVIEVCRNWKMAALKYYIVIDNFTNIINRDVTLSNIVLSLVVP